MKSTVTSLVRFMVLSLAVGLSVTAFAQNPPPPSENSATASLAGTSWNVVETDSDASRDIFNFMPDGTLNYSYQHGTYSNGTWKQDGDSINIEMNHKFVEYKGRINGTHIEGTATNVKGGNWTWGADKR